MTTPPQPGLTNNRPDKDTAIELIRGLLYSGPRRVINYTQESALLSQNPPQWRHLYRFFINTSDGLYNISGLVTLLFGIKLNDRSCTVSLSQMTAEQDLAAFIQAFRKHLNVPDLVLEDLIASAQETLEWTLNPKIIQQSPEYEQQ